MKTRLFLLLILCLGFCSGCNIFVYPLYLVMPDLGKKEVPAEYDFQEGETLAIAVYADMDTLFSYPFVREEVSDAVLAQFVKHVENVELIDYVKVIQYQQSNVYWHTQPLAQLGKAVDADYVLYISLNEFRTYDRGSISLPHGIVNASAMLIKTSDCYDESGKLLPQTYLWSKSVISIDEDASIGLVYQDNTVLRQLIEYKLSEKLVKSFYAHDEGGHEKMPEK